MNLTRMTSFLPVLFITIAVAGCADRKNISPMPSISEEAKKDLSAPVHCGTATHDIATLEEEKASVGKQVLAGVRSVIPFSAAAGILLGDYRDRAQVATGEYNRDLEAKIAQIRQECNIQ